MEAPKTAADMARIYSSAQAKVTYSDGSEKIFPLRYEASLRGPPLLARSAFCSVFS
jgi:hypothetical protein